MADTSLEPSSENLENVKLKCLRYTERKEQVKDSVTEQKKTGDISSEEYRSLKPSKTKRQHSNTLESNEMLLCTSNTNSANLR